ncbi:PII uridylyl-transferase [Pseudomonas aeruginosa]|nr:PII uridylyl-transferase [Pseudomonas aeruginosa]
MPPWDTQLVSWLVQNHLVMSTTAQRKDLSDPQVIFDFAKLVGDQTHLDYLYVLTVADINATNPTLWNSWRASLLRQLYTETKRALRRGLENPVDREEQIRQTQTAALDQLVRNGIDQDDAEQLWSQLGDDYFLRHTAGDVAWHTEAIPPAPGRRHAAGADQGNHPARVRERFADLSSTPPTSTISSRSPWPPWTSST